MSSTSPTDEIANLQALVLSRVDGLLVGHTRETRTFDHVWLAHRKGIPMVQFARICEALPVPKVVENDVADSRVVVRHLLACGARRVGLLTGPPDLLISRLREEGYRAALAEAGVTVPDEWIFNTQFRRDDVSAALDHWLALPEPPDAVFAIYDAGAVELMRLLKQRGIAVPDRVQVAGFGNDPVAELVEPALTTYAQFPREIGRQAFRFFLDQLVEQTTADRLHTVPGELIARQSTRAGKR